MQKTRQLGILYFLTKVDIMVRVKLSSVKTFFQTPLLFIDAKQKDIKLKQPLIERVAKGDEAATLEMLIML